MYKVKHIKWILFIIVFIMLLFPYLHAIYYSVPTADDIIDIKYLYPNDSYIVGAFKQANASWTGWHGAWPCMFLFELLAPSNYFDIADTMSFGIVMIVFFTLFTAIYIYSGSCILYWLFGIEDRFLRIVIPSILLIMLLYINVYIEAFMYYGGVTYVWFLGFGLLSYSMLINWLNTSKIRYMILLCITGALSCTYLVNCVPVGIIYISFCLGEWLKTRKFKPIRIIPLVIFILAGLSNVLAPGNYIRHSRMDTSGVHILSNIKPAIIEACKRVSLYKSPLFILCFLILLIIGYAFASKIKKRLNIPIICATLFIAGIGIVFPVMVGYSNNHIPNRVWFVFDCLILGGISIICIYLGAVIYNKFKIIFNKKDFLILGFSMFVFFYSCICISDQYKSSAIYRYITKYNSIEAEHNVYINILQQIKNSNEDNVVIYVDNLKRTSLIKGLYLKEDSSYWENMMLCNYYGKESISVKYINGSDY